MTYPRDRIRTILVILVFVRIKFIPAALLIGFWFLTQLFNAGSVAQVQSGGMAYLAHIEAASSLGRQRLVSSKSLGESHNERGGVTSYRWFQELHFIGLDLGCIG